MGFNQLVKAFVEDGMAREEARKYAEEVINEGCTTDQAPRKV
jgi:polyhydroxyalkanoate synthesis regulator phasin